jgi:replicative DNA helicase
VVDYLQLMSVPGTRDNRTAEVSVISRSLKSLARDLGVPVVALSQVNRGATKNPDGRPRLADLRESGSIEQDADVVVFIHREDYQNPDSEKKGEAELIIAKQRNGPTGKIDVIFRHGSTRFENRAEDYYSELEAHV